MQKRRASWLWPILVATIIFLGSVASNQITGPVADFLQAHQGWVLGILGLSFLVALAEAIRSQQSVPPTPPIDTSIADAHEALRNRYLSRIVDQSQYLPLRAVDFKSANAETSERERLQLANVYIALNTTTPTTKDEKSITTESDNDSEEELGFLSVLEAAAKYPRLVMLGEPGSGKSTFLNHLAFCLASDTLDPRQGWIDHLDGLSAILKAALPVPIVLREVAAWFAQTQLPDRKAGLLQSYICYWLHQMGLDEFEEILLQRLREGRCILLLDGLDEVHQLDDILDRVKEMIDDLPSAYPQTPIIVTCRVLSYQDERWRLASKSWAVVELAKLTETQIDNFIVAWYRQLSAMNVVKQSESLGAQLSRAVKRRDLWRLARNPLLLTVMALVHSNKGELPDARVLLYEDLVDLLLWRWEAIKLEEHSSHAISWRQLLRSAELNDIDLKKTLWELAFRVHGQSQRTQANTEATADISVHELLETLRVLHPERSLDWAEQLVQIMSQRAGLLIETRPKVYSFPHRTFQEYLAGCHLSVQPDFTDQAKELAVKDTLWWQVIVLAVGRLVHAGTIDPPLLLVDELCPEKTPSSDDVTVWRNIWLAGQCLIEIGLTRAARRNLGDKLIGRVRQHLITLITHDLLEPRERAEAGTILSVIGDHRDLDEMLLIPAGPFIMGSTDEQIEVATSKLLSDYKRDNIDIEHRPHRRTSILAECNQHSLYLGNFKIGRYPVTNSQYAKFVAAKRYPSPKHWRGETPPIELRNHPVVYVSWYDACAYCDWLGEKLGKQVRLPTEAEWEKAARGTEGNVFPWGNEFDPQLCNMGALGIFDTTTVGIFSAGASPYGCLDCSGNVWEWTLNQWGTDIDETQYLYPYNANDGREETTSKDDVYRILRGGCFYNHESRVRCAYRGGEHQPMDRKDNNGFRIVIVG